MAPMVAGSGIAYASLAPSTSVTGRGSLVVNTISTTSSGRGARNMSLALGRVLSRVVVGIGDSGSGVICHVGNVHVIGIGDGGNALACTGTNGGTM